MKQETVSGSGISWAVCKSTLRSRQITTPALHRSVFYRPYALPLNQQRQSTEGTVLLLTGSMVCLFAGVSSHSRQTAARPLRLRGTACLTRDLPPATAATSATDTGPTTVGEICRQVDLG